MDLHLKTYDGRHGPDDIRYKFTGKERDADTGYDYMEQRYYYPPLSIWLRPDPLLDKYIHLSPYVYCNGNPMKYVDPEGEENVLALSKADRMTPAIIAAAQNFPINTEVIHIWAHGNHNGIEIGSMEYNSTSYITTPEQFNSFLMNQSEIWQSRNDSEPSIIVLHSCSTGSGENSIAEQISSSPLFKNVLIVAPSKNIQVLDGKEYGPADKNNLSNVGEWKMFLNGDLVNSFDGTTIPIFNNPQKHIDKYLNEQR